MVGNKIIFVFAIIFLAFSFFFALAQEGSEEIVLSEEAQISQNDESQKIIQQEEIVDFQIITSFEKFRIKRGESFNYFVTIRNTGTKTLERLKVSLVLPEGLISEETEKLCENLGAGEECSLSFLLRTTLSSSLGKKELKVRVTYG